jgi:hypothetical protein
MSITVNKLRNEDLSILYFIKDLLSSIVSNVLDGYPYNSLQDEKLILPAVAIEHDRTAEEAGELGSNWTEREWSVYIFAATDAKRDEIMGAIFDGLSAAIPIKDFSGGYNSDTGKSKAGLDLRVIEYVTPDNRVLRPLYDFSSYMQNKFFRGKITFRTVSTNRS